MGLSLFRQRALDVTIPECDSLAKVRTVGFSVGYMVANVIQLFSFLVLLWCLLSWFPNIRWYDQPWKTLDRIVQPVVAPFRKILPPINGIDLSPMVAMLVLQAIGGMCRYLP